MPFLAPVVGVIFAGGWVTQLVVGVGLSIASTLLSNALRPKPQAQTQRDPGVSLSMQIGGTSPLSIIVGLSATAGHRVYAGSWGHVGETPNAYFVDVLELANVRIDGLNGVFVEKERGTILWGEAHPEFGYPIAQGRRGGVDYLWVKFLRGDQTTPDPYLRAKFGSHPSRPYDADMVGYDTPVAIVTTRYNRENWNGRPPSMLFEVRGIRCYDIRKDSTAGGAGAHRRNDPATWEWSKNPYVIAYNTAFMGVYVGTEWLWGLQNLPALRLPQSAWIAAMNEADRTLTGWEGAQFEIGGEITVDMQPAAVLDEIAKASMGKFIESAGSYKPRCGLPGASVWSFGEGELLVTESKSITPFPGLEATHNAVEISYSEPGEAWRSKQAPEATDAAMVLADGNRKLPAGLELGMVNRNEQAQRLGWSYLRDGRRFRTFRGSFHPTSWALEPGDVIDGTILAEGYNGKAFEIIEMSGRRSFVQTMTIREVDPADFEPPASAWQSWTVGPTQTIYPPSQPATGISFAPLIMLDNDNVGRRPGLEGFYQGGMDDVRYFAVQVRRPGDTLPFFEGEFPYRADVVGEAGQPLFSQAFVPNMAVEARGKYVPFTSRQTDWLSWMPVTLPNVRLGADDIDIAFDQIAAEVVEDLKFISTSVRSVQAAIDTLGTLVAEQDAVNFNDKDSLRRELRKKTGELEANFIEFIEVALGPGGAIAQKFEGLYAAMGGSSAEVRVRWGAEATPVGVEARWGMQLSTDGSTFGTAAIMAQVRNGQSEIILDADRTVVSADGGQTVIAVFTEDAGGQAIFRNALIKNLTAENVQVGTLTGNLFVAGSISSQAINVIELVGSTAFLDHLEVGTLQLADGAVTATQSEVVPYSELAANTPRTATITFADVPASGLVTVSAIVQLVRSNPSEPRSGIYNLVLRRNGTEIARRNVTISDSTQAVIEMEIMRLDRVPASGAQTYTATVDGGWVSVATNKHFINNFMILGEFARK